MSDDPMMTVNRDLLCDGINLMAHILADMQKWAADNAVEWRRPHYVVADWDGDIEAEWFRKGWKWSLLSIRTTAKLISVLGSNQDKDGHLHWEIGLENIAYPDLDIDKLCRWLYSIPTQD